MKYVYSHKVTNQLNMSQEHCPGSKKRFTILTVTNVVLATVAVVYLSIQNISHSKAGEMPDFTAVRA